MAHGSRHFDVLAPRSKFYQGPFGRVFPDLDPWDPGIPESQLDQALLDFANNEMIEAPGKTPGQITADPTLRQQLEADFSSSIPAGYVYFGQFVDHDITFDPASTLVRREDPSGLFNFRTPRLDLDNLYGRGPADQPYLYEHDGSGAFTGKMAIGTVETDPALPDLPRFRGRALIGDMRNDENSIVSQLQLAFLLAHNTLVDRAQAQNPGASVDELFETARRTLRWLYQHIVWNDFVRRIAIDAVHSCALQLKDKCGGRKAWETGLRDVFAWRNQPYIPIEFSAAAYRFGHSMVRNEYQTNNPVRGFQNFVPIFDNSAGSSGDNLRGFRPMTPANSIQWDWFLPMQSSAPGLFPQMARKIDTKLANALAFLHEGPVGNPMNVLAFRNLKRGLVFSLPSGTSVANHLGATPHAITNPIEDSLWFYVLREAQANGGDTLGRVGSIIVCATFAGLLAGDPSSYFNLVPTWTPDDDPLLNTDPANPDNRDDPAWTLAAIIRLARLEATGIGQEP